MDTPRVLIIESDDALRVLMFTMLRHQPVSVDTATSAAEALEKVGKCDYAMILIDVDMPGAEASSFLEAYAETGREPRSVIIAVRTPASTVPLDPDVVAAILPRPLELDTLAGIVRECAPLIPMPDPPLACPPAESLYGSGSDRRSGLAN
jgi:DNA-binding NtrC family response regulator